MIKIGLFRPKRRLKITSLLKNVLKTSFFYPKMTVFYPKIRHFRKTPCTNLRFCKIRDNPRNLVARQTRDFPFRQRSAVQPRPNRAHETWYEGNNPRFRKTRLSLGLFILGISSLPPSRLHREKRRLQGGFVEYHVNGR